MVKATKKAKSKLAQARIAKGMNQTTLAAKIGYSPSYYAMVEREPSFLTDDIAAKAAKILGVSPGDLK